MDPQSFSDRLRKLAIEANVFGDDLAAYQGVRGHSLRRGMITQAILEDYDVVKIATHSRHKDILTLKRYADQVVLEQRTDWTSAIYGPVLAGALAEAS